VKLLSAEGKLLNCRFGRRKSCVCESVCECVSV